MAPIYDTDIAQDRWNQEEWKDFELWERAELRFRRTRMFWILGTAILCLILSSVPVFMSRAPKWATLRLAAAAAGEINRIKREATVDHAAFRIRFFSDERIRFEVEKAPTCDSSSFHKVREGSLLDEARAGEYALISAATATKLGIPSIVESFCYEIVTGSMHAYRGNETVGFGWIPVKDLSEDRSDRVSILLMQGTSAELFFD